MRALLLIAALLASWPLAALAQGARVVVVADGDGAAPLAQRLEAELTSLGFAPSGVERDAATLTEPEIAELAASLECAFVLVVSPAHDAIDVWAAEPAARAATKRGTIAEPGDHPSISVLAIRAVEFLRALELEVAQAQARPAEPAAPVPILEPTVPLDSPGVDTRRLRRGWSARRLELGLGVAVQWSPGGVGASGEVLVDASYRFWRWLGVHLLGMVPVVRAVVTGPEGRARIWPGMVGGGLRLTFGPDARTNRIGGVVDLGVAAAVLGMEGEAVAPYRSLGDRVWSAAPYLRPRLTVRLLSWLELDVDVLVGVAAPQPIVRFANRDAASWGLPFLAFGVGLAGLLL